jgi:hypothetical protein
MTFLLFVVSGSWKIVFLCVVGSQSHGVDAVVSEGRGRLRHKEKEQGSRDKCDQSKSDLGVCQVTGLR